MANNITQFIGIYKDLSLDLRSVVDSFIDLTEEIKIELSKQGFAIYHACDKKIQSLIFNYVNIRICSVFTYGGLFHGNCISQTNQQIEIMKNDIDIRVNRLLCKKFH